LQEPVLRKAFTRFRLPWRWDGNVATLQSRAWDEAGNVQPTRAEFVASRGELKTVPPVAAVLNQHCNAVTSWACIGCTFPPGDWDGVRKNEVTGSNSYPKIIARYRQDSAGRARRLAGDGKGLACPLRGDVVEASTVAVEHRLLASKLLPALHREWPVGAIGPDRPSSPPL
jgi:hypothetical protein